MGSSKATSAVCTAAPARNFTVTTEAKTRAAIAGPPAYLLRKRRIEDIEDALVAKLVDLAERSCSAHPGDDDAASRAFACAVRDIDLAPVNSLVETHNRYYPCEANLPMDPRTGALLDRGRPWKPLEPCTVERLIGRMPLTRSGSVRHKAIARATQLFGGTGGHRGPAAGMVSPCQETSES
jgi:hypothetical protein